MKVQRTIGAVLLNVIVIGLMLLAVLPCYSTSVIVDMGELQAGDYWPIPVGDEPQGDGWVNSLDVIPLANGWNCLEGQPCYEANWPADHDKDGWIGPLDVIPVSNNWMVGAPLVVYDLTVTSDGNGTTTPSGTRVSVSECGVFVNAIPNGGYSFDTWTGDTGYLDAAANMAANSVTYTGSQSITITLQANFIAD